MGGFALPILPVSRGTCRVQPPKLRYPAAISGSEIPGRPPIHPGSIVQVVSAADNDTAADDDADLIDMAVQRTDLFALPVWQSRLDEMAPHAPDMIAVADGVIRDTPVHSAEPFAQSQGVLQKSPDPNWRRFFGLVGQVMERVLGSEFVPQRPVASAWLESFVMRIDDPAEYVRTAGMDMLHSHVPFALSSVFYLSVPSALEGAEHGGTSFRDPMAVNGRLFRSPTHHIPAHPMELLVFPAFVEHQTDFPVPLEPWDRPRTVVVTDLMVSYG